MILKNKKGIIFGIANDHSIAWGIARKFSNEGAELAITYQNDTFLKRVKPLASQVNSEILLECDFSQDSSIKNCFSTISQKWDNIDFIVHAAAYSDKNELNGRYLETSKDNFINTLNISCFSFTEIAKYASNLMPNGGSLITMSFYGSTKVMPNYNVMGVAKASLEASVRYLAASVGRAHVRVNAISAGPIKTLAAAGIKDFRKIQATYAQHTPLQRNVTAEEVGHTAAFLCSDLASGITAEVIHVDAGYHAVTMMDVD